MKNDRHGVKQPRNPWSDGPVYITQCPIKPGANFTYKIIVSTEEGTLWWHAHSDWSRTTVHGPIIILPKIGTTYPFPKPHAEVPIVLATIFQSCSKPYHGISCWNFKGMEIKTSPKDTNKEQNE